MHDPFTSGAPVRVALAGYGLAGRVFHAPLIQAVEGFELATVVSGDPAKVHADLPGITVVADLDSALRDPSIALVVVATPDHVHSAQAMSAIAAGKHVVVDKPLAPTLAEAQRIADHAAASGKLLTVFHNRRWDADFLTLRRLIEEGQLGEIIQFESHFDRFRPVIGERWKDRRDGGVWQDLGPHLVDQVLCLFGMPESVIADIGTLKFGNPAADHAHVILRYPNMRAILHTSQSIPAHSLRFAVHGTKGSFIKHGLDPQEDQSKAGLTPADPVFGLDPVEGLLSCVEGSEVGPPLGVPGERGDYTAFYRAMHRAIVAGCDLPVSVCDALKVMEVIAAAQTSQTSGAAVKLA